MVRKIVFVAVDGDLINYIKDNSNCLDVLISRCVRFCQDIYIGYDLDLSFVTKQKMKQQ